MAQLFPVTEKDFTEKVLQSDKITLTDFWAAWCGPCHMIAPVLEEIAEEYDDQLQIAKLDVDHNPQIAMNYGVMSIPTLILFKNGEAVQRIVGFMPKERLLKKILPHLESAS